MILHPTFCFVCPAQLHFDSLSNKSNNNQIISCNRQINRHHIKISTIKSFFCKLLSLGLLLHTVLFQCRSQKNMAWMLFWVFQYNEDILFLCCWFAWCLILQLVFYSLDGWYTAWVGVCILNVGTSIDWYEYVVVRN
jgi:hypothetical protein